MGISTSGESVQGAIRPLISSLESLYSDSHTTLRKWTKNVLDLLGLVRCLRLGSEQRPTSEAAVSTDAKSFCRPIMPCHHEFVAQIGRSSRPVEPSKWTVHESLGL
jgi:hypothetical protein